MINSSRNQLDQVRESKGHNHLVADWQVLVDESFEHAILLINDPMLEFPTLYYLKDHVTDEKVADKLCIRNRIALAHIDNVLKGAELGYTEAKHFSDQHQDIIHTFRWMLSSGRQAMVNPNYSQVIDHVVVQLLLTYCENCHKEVIELIFHRNRHNLHRHYLSWAFYEAIMPHDLFRICPYFASSSKRDRDLAYNLLNFIPSINTINDPHYAYFISKKWLEENLSYLMSTEETNDMSPSPVPFRVQWVAKYLGVHVSKTGESLSDLTSFEKKRWHEFSHDLNEHEQILVANYSYLIRHTKFDHWMNWIHQPLQLQLLESMEGS